MVSPATKKADLGGIDTPPSANRLVVHNPAKCSVFWRSTQGHGEISFPFGNHPPPPHPLFSLRSQTATSQLAGFRNLFLTIFISSEHSSTFLISPKLVSTHPGSSARQKAWDTDAFTRKSLYKILCTTKLAQSTSQYDFVLQSLHKVLPSSTLYYKTWREHLSPHLTSL